MVALIEVTNEVLEEMNKLKIPYDLKKDLENKLTEKDLDDFIYVPSINLYVAKQKTHLGENWFNCHKELQKNNKRMLIVPEFNEFLEYAKINFPEIYNEITEIREPWRAEYLDASFEFKNKKLYINSAHVLNSKGDLIPMNSEILNENTLMQDKEPGISLENLLESSTNQGFPNKNVKSGSLYYRYPRSNNNSVVRFNVDNHRAYLLCDRNPSNRFSYVGVRAVKSGDLACIK